MSDKKLLELLAKAAGYHAVAGRLYGVKGRHLNGGLLCDNDLYWNPQTNDGDLLRLAMKMNMRISFTGEIANVEARVLGKEYQLIGPYRDAILQVAADIGKDME